MPYRHTHSRRLSADVGFSFTPNDDHRRSVAATTPRTPAAKPRLAVATPRYVCGGGGFCETGGNGSTPIEGGVGPAGGLPNGTDTLIALVGGSSERRQRRPMADGIYVGTTYFADVTGEGVADAIVVNTDGITVRRGRAG